MWTAIWLGMKLGFSRLTGFLTPKNIKILLIITAVVVVGWKVNSLFNDYVDTKIEHAKQEQVVVLLQDALEKEKHNKIVVEKVTTVYQPIRERIYIKHDNIEKSINEQIKQGDDGYRCGTIVSNTIDRLYESPPAIDNSK